MVTDIIYHGKNYEIIYKKEKEIDGYKKRKKIFHLLF